MVRWRWLQPGLHLKRWVLAICLGTILLILGAIALGVGIFDLQTLAFRDEQVRFNPYGLAGLLIFLGAGLLFTGIYRLIRRIEKLLKHESESRGLAEIAYQHSRLEQGPRIVCLGGGTGMSAILSGLKEFTSNLTAVVSVADDGGSSGRLRQDLGMLPPGDIRNCLIALANAGPVMAELMQYRFEDGEFAGHAFGNLFITVLAKVRGDFGLAVREANRILSVRGKVVPATLERVNLVATHPDGTKTTGQRHIARCAKPIASLHLRPQPGEPPADVINALTEAEVIVIGPGSLYTSVLPNLLDPEVVEAINRSRALVLFVVNVMSQPGETSAFKVSDHLLSLWKHAPGLRVDAAIINGYRPSPARLQSLEAEGVHFTEYDRREVGKLGVRVLLRDVIDLDRPVRHDATKLATAVFDAWHEQRN